MEKDILILLNFCVDQDSYRNKSIILQAYIQHLKSLLLCLSQHQFCFHHNSFLFSEFT